MTVLSNDLDIIVNWESIVPPFAASMQHSLQDAHNATLSSSLIHITIGSRKTLREGSQWVFPCRR
jgi:hypothetical protein